MTDPSAALPLALLQRLCTSREMARMDAHAIETVGISGKALMENAAGSVAACLLRLFGEAGAKRPVVVCCGSGNNGGDGYAVARLLKADGVEVTVVKVGQPTGADAKANLAEWAARGDTVDFGSDPAAAASRLQGAGAIVDALFGTGLNRPVGGAAGELIAAINAAPAPIKLAVDVPSGMDSDSGRVWSSAVRCSHTVALQIGKVGCYQHPGAAFAGRTEIADISIPVRWEPSAPATYLLNSAFVRQLLPDRPAAGHKGTFGHLLTLCGSTGMGGAALLCSLAALKVGTGLVTAGVPRGLLDGFLAAAPELMTLSAEEGSPEAFQESQGDFFLEAARARSAVVVGCGVGQREATRAFVARVAAELELPLLIDADGLNLLGGKALAARAHPTVITPHPGELLRLSGLGREDLANDRVGQARRLAAEWGVVLLLKGAGSVVAAPGGEVFINPTGDDGLATAGTGDVLSGMIGGFLAQGLEPLAAALAGVYLHGLARDCRREELAPAYFTAGDLIEGINAALKTVAAV